MYVQYRLMSNTFNTTIANWQGVDDILIPESNNLIKSSSVTKVLSEIIKPISNSYPYSILESGYMLDNGSVNTSLQYYYHLTYNVTPGDLFYIKNHFSGDNSNHHILCFDSSDNIVYTFIKGSIINIEDMFMIPDNVTKIVVNYHESTPTILRRIEQRVIPDVISQLQTAIINNQDQINEQQDQITFNEYIIKKQVELSYNTRTGGGFMADNGSITAFANYYYQDYTVSEGDKIYIKNHFSGDNSNHHVILLDSSDNVIGTMFAGNINNIEEIFVIPSLVVKIVVNSHDSTIPTVAKVYDDFIRSQYLQDQINKIADKFIGKKWVLIGDSLTEVNSRTSKNYAGYIQDKTGITVVNMGVSGTGYKNGENNNTSFYKKALNVPTDADIITIFGSFNDLSVQGYDLGSPSDTSTNTMCGCFNKTFDNILSTFMNAGKVPVIGVITPTPWIGKTPNDPTSESSLYCDALIECCKRKSVPVLDLYRCSNLHPNDATFRTLAYSHDDGNGVHPDERGHQIISSEIYEFIKKLLM